MFQEKEVGTQAHNSQNFQQCVELYFIRSDMVFLRTYIVNPKYSLRDYTITVHKLKIIDYIDNQLRVIITVY